MLILHARHRQRNKKRIYENYYKRKKKLNRFINCVKEFENVYHNQFALNLGNIKVFGFLKYQKNIFSIFFSKYKKNKHKKLK